MTPSRYQLQYSTVSNTNPVPVNVYYLEHSSVNGDAAHNSLSKQCSKPFEMVNIQMNNDHDFSTIVASTNDLNNDFDAEYTCDAYENDIYALSVRFLRLHAFGLRS